MKPTDIKIEFSRHELMICELFGTVRRKNAMQFNVDRQVSLQNPYEMDIDGFMGEFAVAKFLNVMVDTSIAEKKNPVDLLWNGKTIDVKSTRVSNASIFVTEYHRTKPCNLYVLVTLENDAAILSGWIDSDGLFKHAEAVGKDHPSYRLDHKYLLPMTALK